MSFFADYALLIMFIILIAITITGVPLGIAMIVSSVFYLVMSGNDVGLAAENVLNGTFGNFVALAVPLFIFAANIMNAGKVSDRLLTFSLALVGRVSRRSGSGEHINFTYFLWYVWIGHF